MVRAVLVALLVSTAHAHAAPPVGATAVIDRPVALVGDDEVIWMSELDARMAAGGERAQVLEAMIDDRVIVREGRRLHVTVEPSDVQAALEEIKKQNNIDDAALDEALAEQGYTRASYLKDLELQLLVLRTKNVAVQPMIVVTDADVDAEIKKRKLATTSAGRKAIDVDRSALRTELRKQQFDEKAAKWFADVKKHARIERRP